MSLNTLQQPPPINQTNSAYHTNNIPTLIKFLLTMTFSPVKSRWIQAIKRGFFQSWPGLATRAVHKPFLQLEATINGHMDQPQKKECTQLNHVLKSTKASTGK
jgi:hypothetical protein